MPSVSSDDAGLEERESDFFDQEAEKVETSTSVAPACSVNKVPTASNITSVCWRVFWFRYLLLIFLLKWLSNVHWNVKDFQINNEKLGSFPLTFYELNNIFSLQLHP